MNSLARSPFTIFAVSLVLFALVLFFNFGTSGAGENSPGRPPGGTGKPLPANTAAATAGNDTKATTQSTTPSVKVRKALPLSYQAQVTGHGGAMAHYQLTLNSRVTGQVRSVAEDFEVGRHVEQGQVLLSLENSGYKASLATAELAYQQAQREAEQAHTEWAASGLEGEPESPLVFYEPQLQEAQANYEAAVANYKDTEVKAAFDGVITSRMVSPGSYITAGSELGEVVSRDRVEISVPLASNEWALLPTPSEMASANWAVTVRDVETGEQWQGRVLRAQSQLDAATRQRSLIVAVDKPFDQAPALLPGTFMEAQVPGRTLEGLWALPSSSLTQRGKIWYIDAEDTLRNFDTSPVFAKANTIYIRPPQDLSRGPQKVLISPMNSYVEGTFVQAQYEQQPDNAEVQHEGRS